MESPNINRILFIKTKHIGDALLMTPTIVAVKKRYPHAQIWAVVRKGTESILDGCTELDRVLTTAPPGGTLKDRLNFCEGLQLIHTLRSQRFDVAIDLSDSSRGRWIALLSGAKKIAADGSARPLSLFWKSRAHELQQPPSVRKAQHRAVKDAKVAALLLDIPEALPALRFDDHRMKVWAELPQGQPHVVMHPGTRWERKRWPVEKWAQLGRHLAAMGRRIVISTAPDPRDMAEATEICAQIGQAAMSTAGRTSWAQLAWIIRHADIFVGVDTAAMHLAAACQRPIVAIFGPSNRIYWSPWQAPHKIVKPAAPEGAHYEALLTSDVLLEDVISACELWL